ncbi:MAG TPA: ribokinase [Candidatus Dormibacteraeota bacterium]|nr:ribokinase [Candidatus Dormibacteraeota bacterium]
MGSVVVLGSINMDLVVRVRELPRPGDTVLGERLLTIAGGKGGNQAVAAARLGASVRMIGRVGADSFGPALIAGLQEDGVDTSGVVVDEAEPSGAALIVVDASGENEITVAPGASSRVGREELERLRLSPGDVLVMQLEIPLDAVLGAIEVAHSAGARVVLNAAPSGLLAGRPMPRVDVLIVNEGEAADLGGEALRGAVGALVVTLGAAGAVVYDGDRETRIEAHRVEAVDATAAGDAVVGAAAFALARGASVVDAIRLGNAAGAAAVTKMGARPSLPTPGDLKRLFGIELDEFVKVKT